MVDILMREEIALSLRALGREAALGFASRAALRVTPLLWPLVGYARDGDGAAGLTVILTAWRATCATWVAVSYPTDGAEIAACYPATAAGMWLNADSSFLFSADRFAASSAVAAAARAASVAGPVGGEVNFEAAAAVGVTEAVAAMAGAAEASGHDPKSAAGAVQSAADADLTVLNQRGAAALVRLPLWPGGAPAWVLRVWDEMKEVLIARNTHWRVWTEWHDARLRGEPPATAEIELARIGWEDTFWKQGAEVVNAEIARRIKPGPSA